MAPALPIRRLTHGVVRRELGSSEIERGGTWHNYFTLDNSTLDERTLDGEAHPRVEWTYLAPPPLPALSRTELRDSLPDVQRRTILFWFSLNLRPYDLSGGQYFSFGSPSAGFNQAPFAPTPLTAREVIEGEFGDILSQPYLETFAGDLPGQWMWYTRPSQLPLAQTTATREQVVAELSARVAQLEAHLGARSIGRGEFGHNSGDIEFPVSLEETDAAREILAALLERVESSSLSGGLTGVWEKMRPLAAKLGTWLGKKADIYVSETAKSLGQETGNAIAWTIKAYVLYLAIDQLIQLLN